MISKGRIVEIKRETAQRICTGIKGGHGFERTPFGYYNGYGAFMEYPENHLYLVAFIYAIKRTVSFDIRQWVLENSGRRRISQKYLDYLKSANEGKKIWFEEDFDGDWVIQDYDELDC